MCMQNNKTTTTRRGLKLFVQELPQTPQATFPDSTPHARRRLTEAADSQGESERQLTKARATMPANVRIRRPLGVWLPTSTQRLINRIHQGVNGSRNRRRSGTGASLSERALRQCAVAAPPSEATGCNWQTCRVRSARATLRPC